MAEVRVEEEAAAPEKAIGPEPSAGEDDEDEVDADREVAPKRQRREVSSSDCRLISLDTMGIVADVWRQHESCFVHPLSTCFYLWMELLRIYFWCPYSLFRFRSIVFPVLGFCWSS
eukprot:6186543-Pleurochrysis_carterae.AAC.1